MMLYFSLLLSKISLCILLIRITSWTVSLDSWHYDSKLIHNHERNYLFIHCDFQKKHFTVRLCLDLWAVYSTYHS